MNANAVNPSGLSSDQSFLMGLNLERGSPESLAAIARNQDKIESHFKKVVSRYIKKYYANDDDAKWVHANMQIRLGFFISNFAAVTDFEDWQIVINGDMYENTRNKARFARVVMHEFIHLVREKKGLHEPTEENHINHHCDGFVAEMNRLGFNGNVVLHDFKPKFAFRYRCRDCGSVFYYNTRQDFGPCRRCTSENVTYKVQRVEVAERLTGLSFA